MENQWKAYFTFTKKERTGIIVLLFLIAIITAAPFFFETTRIPKGESLDEQERILANALANPIQRDSPMTKRYKEEEEYNIGGPGKTVNVSLFTFDPNTIDAVGWKKLGIRERTIQTIQKYLAKGGRFRKPEDVGNIYGMRKQEFGRLQPYIQIAPVVNERPVSVTPSRESFSKKTEPVIIDINTADSSAFIALPGIGSKLAARILSFRDKLGGFYAIEQVREIYGLPDSVFQRIQPWLRCGSPVTRTININTADAATLKVHPYIKWNIANAIVQYRQQHGPFGSVVEIRQIGVITPENFQKIVLYLTVK